MLFYGGRNAAIQPRMACVLLVGLSALFSIYYASFVRAYTVALLTPLFAGCMLAFLPLDLAYDRVGYATKNPLPLLGSFHVFLWPPIVAEIRGQRARFLCRYRHPIKPTYPIDAYCLDRNVAPFGCL